MQPGSWIERILRDPSTDARLSDNLRAALLRYRDSERILDMADDVAKYRRARREDEVP
jgi:hypothetical protein